MITPDWHSAAAMKPINSPATNTMMEKEQFPTEDADYDEDASDTIKKWKDKFISETDK